MEAENRSFSSGLKIFFLQGAAVIKMISFSHSPGIREIIFTASANNRRRFAAVNKNNIIPFAPPAY